MTPTPSQLRIAADIIEHSLPWEYYYAVSNTWVTAYPLTNPIPFIGMNWQIRLLPSVPWTLHRHIPGFRPLSDTEQWHRDDFTEEMLPAGWRPLLLSEKCLAGDHFCGHTGVWGKQSCDYGSPAKQTWRPHRTQRPLPPLSKTRADEKAAQLRLAEDINEKSLLWQWRRKDGTPGWWESCHWNTGNGPVGALLEGYEIRLKPQQPLPIAPEPEPEPEYIPLEPCDIPPGSAIRAVGWRPASWEMVTGVAAQCISYDGGPHVSFHDLMVDGWSILRPNSTEWLPCRKPIK